MDRKSFKQEKEEKLEKEPVFSSSKGLGEKTEVLRDERPEGFQTTTESSQIPEIKPLQTSDAKVTKSKPTESKNFETNTPEATLRGAKSLEMDAKKKAEDVKKAWPEGSGLKVIRDTPKMQPKKPKKKFSFFSWFKKSKKSKKR